MSGGTGSRQRPGTVVELVGLPGAGKSRRVRMLTEVLRDRGVPVAQAQATVAPAVPGPLRILRKAAMSAQVLARRPGTSSVVVGALRRSGQPGTWDVPGRAVQWLVGQHLTARSGREGGVALLDEGPVQALWSTGLRGDVGPVLDVLARADGWRAPDVLLVVRASPETVLARLAARRSRHARTQLLGEAERLAELERGEDLLDRLVGWWSRLPGRRTLLEVSGTDDSAATTARLADRIAAEVR